MLLVVHVREPFPPQSSSFCFESSTVSALMPVLICRCNEIIAPVLRQRRNLMVKMGSVLGVTGMHGLPPEDNSYAGSPVLNSLTHNLAQQSLTGLGPAFHEELSIVGDDGEIYKTNRVSKMISEDTHAVGVAAKYGVTGLLALVALGAAVAGRGFERAAGLAGLGGLAYSKVSPDGSRHERRLTTLEGIEVPKSTVFYATGKTAASAPLRPAMPYLALDLLFSTAS